MHIEKEAFIALIQKVSLVAVRFAVRGYETDCASVAPLSQTEGPRVYLDQKVDVQVMHS